jgi:hypothetical protein
MVLNSSAACGKSACTDSPLVEGIFSQGLQSLVFIKIRRAAVNKNEMK